MVVEEEFLAEQLEEKTDQENVVGRIAGMDHVESALPHHLPRQEELPKQGGGIFDEVAESALGLQGKGVAKNMDFFQDFMALFIPLADGADHG